MPNFNTQILPLVQQCPEESKRVFQMANDILLDPMFQMLSPNTKNGLEGFFKYQIKKVIYNRHSSDYGSQYTYRFGYASLENSQKLRKITTNLRTSMGGWEDEMERDSNVRFSRR